MRSGQLCLALLGLAACAAAMQDCPHCETVGGSSGETTVTHSVVAAGQPAYTTSQQRQSSSAVFRQPAVGASSVDPCVPSPCGPNTECSINNRGVGVCRCLPGFFPKPDTITGCGPQCVSDGECGQGYVCRGQKCIQVTASYTGSTGSSAHGGQQSSTLISRNTAAAAADPCSLGLCGTNADCTNVGGRAVCSCPSGYEGNPLVACRKGECVDDSQCPAHMACLGVRCVDPCSKAVCGTNANCKVVRHKAICSCPSSYTGDPFVLCRYSPQATGAVQTGASQTGGGGGSGVGNQGTAYPDICSPSPCGQNTNCQPKAGRAVCSCVDGYIGDPLTACRPECTEDAECAGHQTCVGNRCKNACLNACGKNARCEAVNHRAVCKCPQYYQGNPLTTGCYPECTSHTDCAADKACIQLRCADPCAGACGIDANCKVRDHTAICSCPRGYLGHPYDRCTPPQQAAPAAAAAAATTAEHSSQAGAVCETCEETAVSGASTAGVFVQSSASSGDMCSPNPCGAEAKCTPGTDKLGQPRPVCTCPVGYLGDPLTACQKGECVDHSNCPASQACYNYICKNPCLSAAGGNVCGTNALCRSQNHKAVCYCPPEYTGEPLTECRLKPVASEHRSKRFLDRLTKA